MLSTANLTMQFGGKPLFENVSLKFDQGARYGLIGANGCGKSTFLKILAGQLEASSGSISIGPQLRVSTLGQNQFAFEEYRVLDTVIMGHRELWEIKQERDRIYAKAEMTEEEGMRVADLEVQFAEMDGYSAEAQAGELLSGLDIPLELHTQPMREVAPGLKLRVLLAQVLFANPDIMLLDEPTNNLDIDTIRWVENILQQSRATMIIISHDRHFLNTVCTHIADLDYHEIRIYPGNYDEYMTAATLAQEKLMVERARKEAKIKELQTFVSRFSANASKARQATSRARLIEKIKIEELKPSSRRSPYLRFDQEKKLFRSVLNVAKLTNGYDENVLFKNLNFSLDTEERLAVIGPNGIGKSTLLKTLLNQLPAKSGEIAWAENANIGYYPQEHKAQFDTNMNLFDWMAQWRKEGDDEQAIRGVLGRLLFSGKDLEKKVQVLSGGEQGRMLFGKLIMQKYNVLVMDEPTNHMDMETIEALNLALENFPGTLIFVSHDRQFVSSLATRLLVMTPEHKVIDYRGGYEEYLATLE